MISTVHRNNRRQIKSPVALKNMDGGLLSPPMRKVTNCSGHSDRQFKTYQDQSHSPDASHPGVSGVICPMSKFGNKQHWIRGEFVRHRILELRSQGVALKAINIPGVNHKGIGRHWTKICKALGNNDPFYIAFWWYKRQTANNGNKIHEASRDISDSRDRCSGARVGNQSICR